MDMKLQFKDQTTFQANAGYEDDPCYVPESNVRETLVDWYRRITEINEEGIKPESYSIELANLSTFLCNLAKCEIEYTEPLKKFEFNYIFEMASPFSIEAHSQEEADTLAEKYIRKHLEELKANAEAFRQELYSIDRNVTVWESY